MPVMRPHNIRFDDATYEKIVQRASDENTDVSNIVRKACRRYCGFELKKDPEREIPVRFKRAISIIDIMAAMVGNDIREEFKLLYDDHLGEYDSWERARRGVQYLCTLLRSLQVGVIMEENRRSIPIPDSEVKRNYIFKEGFTICFEHPVKRKDLLHYKSSIVKKLKSTDIIEMIVEREKANADAHTAKPDDSKELKEELGSDDEEDLNNLEEVVKGKEE